MSKNFKILLLFIFVGMTSCQEAMQTRQKSPTLKTDFKVKISYSAGDIYEDYNDKIIPLFFNVGSLNGHDSIPVIVISEKIKKGQTVDIIPNEILRINHESSHSKFLVASLSTVENASHPKNIDQQTKLLIENWFALNCPLWKCQSMDWFSSLHAYALLDHQKNKFEK